MTMGVRAGNEIGVLRKVLLHRPGNELLNLTPGTLDELLFDDIPYLKKAQEEHDAFAATLRMHGAETVYLEDLMSECLANDSSLVQPFVMQWLREGNIHTPKWQERLYDYIMSHFTGRDLVLKTMEGITLQEIGGPQPDSLVDLVSGPGELVVNPMPNLYFQRDPFAVIGHGISLNHMHFETRKRETIYAEYIFREHPGFKGKVPQYYSRTGKFSVEGGDILNLSPQILAVGISQRTEPDAIEELARNLFADPDASIERVLAFYIPDKRAFMHLDTVFTQVNTDQFTVHPGILGELQVFELTPDNGRPEHLCITPLRDTLENILKSVLGLPEIDLISCGGEDMIAAEREQWNDGSNTLAIAPGKIVVYDRNEATNHLLQEHGLEVIPIPSSELSRGRGGPRCMSMPLVREDI